MPHPYDTAAPSNWYRMKFEHLVALFIILAFAGFSIPRLALPFFWDATWVYAPAIYEMSRGVPSLLADSIPVHIGRGHPLMFHFLASLWVKLFGFSIISLNAFALTVSVGVLSMVYLLGTRIFGRGAGLAALTICATQEMVHAQALQILPEMMLALFVLTTLYTYLDKQKGLFVLSASALLLTKETGVVMIAALGVVLLLEVFLTTEKTRRPGVLGRGILLLALPVGIASLHYLYQKAVFGWFFFPEHMEMQIWDFNPILYRLRDVFDLIFMWQGRQVVTILALTGLCVWIGRRRIWQGIAAAGLIVAMHQIFYEGFQLPVWVRFAVPLFCFMVVCGGLLIPFVKKQPAKGLSIAALVIYLAVFMAFTATNLLTSRYVLNGIPVFALLTGMIISRYMVSRWISLVFLVLLGGVFFFQLNQPRLVRDINLTYADGVKMYQEIVQFFDSEAEKPCRVLGTLLEAVAMGDKRACYVNEPLKDVTVIIQRDTLKIVNREIDYFINSNVLEYVPLPASDPGCCLLVREILVGQAKAEIYRVLPGEHR